MSCSLRSVNSMLGLLFFGPCLSSAAYRQTNMLKLICVIQAFPRDETDVAVWFLTQHNIVAMIQHFGIPFNPILGLIKTRMMPGCWIECLCSEGTEYYWTAPIHKINQQGKV